MTLVPSPPKAPRSVSVEAATKLHLMWLDNLETAFERVMTRSLKRALKPVTSKFTALTAQGEPEPAVPPGEPFISIDDLTLLRTTWAAEVAQELLPLLGEVYVTGAQSVNLAVGAVSTEVPDVVSVGAQEWLGLSQNRLTRIGDTTWLNMRDELLEGFQRGESIDALAKRVRQTANVSAQRARTIARTEVIGASNAGSFAEARVMEVEFKTWLNTDDPRTRPTHVAAGDQRVQIDEPFIVGGSRLRFPHDPLAPPSETINCRCTMTFDEDPLCVCTPGWVQRENGEKTETDCGCSEEVDEDIIASLDPIGIITFPVAHDPKNGRFVPGRGGGKRPPKVTYKPGSGGVSEAEKSKAAKPKAKPKKPAGSEFGEGKSFDQAKAEEFGEEGFKEWRGNLSSSEKTGIKAYTDSGFAKGINDRLRGVPLDSENAGRVKTIDKHIANIRSAFDAPGARTPRAVTVHRVMSGPLAERIITAHHQGRVVTSAGGAKFRDDGIVSTSLDRSIATKSSAAKNKRVTMEIDVPRGQRAVYPGSLSRFPIESELMLPPGTAFEVTGAGTRGGVLNLRVKIIDSL